MQIKSAKFTLSARDLAASPQWHFPEFAFIGRSNVGKSSMINMLSNKDHLAKVSATPGKTRLLNFFVMNESWSLVDLPGYGYAKVAKSEKMDFTESVGDYIEQRENLKHVFVLIDSRLSPQRIDIDFTSWLATCAVPFTLVFTKTDKQSPAKTRTTIDTFLTSMPADIVTNSKVITSSSKNRTGRIDVLKVIQHHLVA